MLRTSLLLFAWTACAPPSTQVAAAPSPPAPSPPASTPAYTASPRGAILARVACDGSAGVEWIDVVIESADDDAMHACESEVRTWECHGKAHREERPCAGEPLGPAPLVKPDATVMRETHAAGPQGHVASYVVFDSRKACEAKRDEARAKLTVDEAEIRRTSLEAQRSIFVQEIETSRESRRALEARVGGPVAEYVAKVKTRYEHARGAARSRAAREMIDADAVRIEDARLVRIIESSEKLVASLDRMPPAPPSMTFECLAAGGP